MKNRRSLFSLIPSLFFSFRLVYIPVSILSHTGHGLAWLNIAAGLAATFATEALVRRGQQAGSAFTTRRDGTLVIVALLLLGLFPEEAPIGVILWAAIGAAWGRLGRVNAQPTTIVVRIAVRIAARIVALVGGALLGMTALWGPGSWLMAGLLALWLWRQSTYRPTPDD